MGLPGSVALHNAGRRSRPPPTDRCLQRTYRPSSRLSVGSRDGDRARPSTSSVHFVRAGEDRTMTSATPAAKATRASSPLQAQRMQGTWIVVLGRRVAVRCVFRQNRFMFRIMIAALLVPLSAYGGGSVFEVCKGESKNVVAGTGQLSIAFIYPDDFPGRTTREVLYPI